jgi:hypothetical protein
MQNSASDAGVTSFARPATQYQSRRSEFGLYGRMFVEDVQNSVVPYSTSRSRDLIYLGGTDRELGATLLSSIAQNGDRSDSGSAIEAIRGLARALAEHGSTRFELLRAENGRGLIAQEVGIFRSLAVPAAGLFQYRLRQPWDGARSRWAFVPTWRAWRVSLPPELGTPREQRHLLKTLAQASVYPPEEWMRPGQDVRVPFDFTHFRDRQYAIRCRALQRWNWTQRTTDMNYSTEFFYMHQELQFARAIAMLREHIVDQLNKLFRQQFLDCAIRIESLLSAPEIRELMQKLVEHRLTFGEVMKVKLEGRVPD